MSKRTTKKAPCARSKSLKVQYVQGGKHLSSQAGLIPVVRFLDQLGFGELFSRHVDHDREPFATYQLVDMVFLIVVGLIGGSCSIQQSVLLWADGVLRRVAGWKRIPDDSTVGRVLKEVKERHVSGLESLVHALRRRVWERASPASSGIAGGAVLSTVDRHRLHSEDGVWRAGRQCQRLQSPQKGGTLLSSYPGLLCSDQRDPPGQAPVWRCLYQQWCGGVHEAVGGPDAKALPSGHPGRQWLFHRCPVVVAGAKRPWLSDQGEAQGACRSPGRAELDGDGQRLGAL